MIELTRRAFARALASALGAVLARPRAAAACLQSSEPPYDVVVERDVWTPMRDGVRLCCDVHRPARDGLAIDGRWPVILERTPYDKTAPSRTERPAGAARPMPRAEVAAYFVRHGYIVVYQDVRGRYRSEGRFEKYVADALDGYDTVRWIVRQPWSNGRVGTKGFSYAAHTQGALGALDPPGLACMFVDSGAFSNAYQGGARQGGAFELKQATWAYRNALESPEVKASSTRRAALEAIDIKAWFARLPWRRGASPLTPAPEYEEYLFEQWERGTFDDYWRQPGIYGAGFYDRYADVPMVHVSSWYDPYPRTATENYRGLSDRKRSPMRLVLGPWTHGNRFLTHAGDVDFGPQATFDGHVASDYLDYRLRFFDCYLKGFEARFDSEPRVRLFVMGGGSGRRTAEGRLDHGGRWRDERDWPLPDAVPTRFHLAAGGRLAPPVPRKGEVLAYRFDPGDPVPTIGGAITSGAPVMEGGAYDQREGPRFFGSTPPYEPLAARPDVLVFESEPLEVPVEVTGPIEARLWVGSDAPDTDFTMKLVDVYPPSADYPDGFALNLTDGILRARYRDSWEEPAPMASDQVYAIRVEAFPTSNLFAAGHRIRVDISSSNFPRFDVNPNTGEPEARATAARPAQNRLYIGRDRPSHVVLPVVTPRSGITADAVVFGIEEATGSFSADEENLGFRLAFTEANAAGRIHGRTIAWKGYSRRGGDAEDEAMENARRLVDDDGVAALVNWGGPVAVRLLPFVRARRVPYLFPHSALVSSEGERYLFTSFPRYEGEAAVMFRYLAKGRGLTRLGIVHDHNVYGRLFRDLLEEHSAPAGYTVAGAESVDSREPADLTDALGRLAAAGADAVVMALYPAQARTLVAAKAAIGWRGRLVSVGPLTDEQYLNAPGAPAEGTLGFCYYPDPETSDAPGAVAYRAAMARHHPGRPLNRYSLYGHVFGGIIVEGLKRAGRELTRERLIDAIESLSGWEAGGVMPPVSFSAHDHHAQHAGFICELSGGRFAALGGWIEP
jgi:hypothetical protein